MPQTERIVLEVDEKGVATSISSANREISRLEQSFVRAGQTAEERLLAKIATLQSRMANDPLRLKELDALQRRVLTKTGDNFAGLAGKIREGIQNPLQAAGNAAEGLMQKLGPVGAGLSVGAAALTAVATAAFQAAKSLGEYGVMVKDVELRTGLTAKEVGQFGFAAKAVGQDVTIFERMMRGLTQAVEEDSAAAQKARGWLQKFGVDMNGVRDGSVSTSQVLQQVATGLSALPTTWERNKAALDLFKRAGIEAIPVITELTNNLQIAQQQGFGPTEADISRFTALNVKIAELETHWAGIKRQFQEGLVIEVSFVGTAAKWLLDHAPGETVQGDQASIDRMNAKEALAGDIRRANAAKWGNFPAPNPIAALERKRMEALRGLEPDDAFRGPIDPGDRDYRSPQAVQKMQAAANYQRQIEEAQKKLQTDATAEKQKQLATASDEADRLRARYFGGHDALQKAFDDAKKDVEKYQQLLGDARKDQLDMKAVQDLGAKLGKAAGTEAQAKAALDAAKELEAAQKSLDAFNRDMAHRDEGPLGRLISQRQELPASVRDQAFTPDYVRALTAEAAKEEAAWKKEQAGWATERAKETAKQEEAAVSEMDKNSERRVRDWLQHVKEVQNKARELDEQGISIAGLATGHALKMSQIGAGPGQEVQQAELAMAYRTEAAKQEFAVKEAHAHLYDMDLARFDLQKEMAVAAYDHEERLAEIEHERFQELRKSMDGLFDAAFSRSHSFLDAIKGMVQAVFLTPIKEALSAGMANLIQPFLYGKEGKGGLMSLLPKFQSGGITNGPSIVGEAGRELVIPIDRLRNFGLGSSPTLLVGKYGPETDAALEKFALAGMGIALPAGLTALAGPAGLDVGEMLMSLVMGGVAVATPPRKDNLMMGVVVPRGGEFSAPEEGRSMFGKDTYEALRAVGSKGGRISGAARSIAAQAKRAQMDVAAALAAEDRHAMMVEKKLYSDADWRGGDSWDQFLGREGRTVTTAADRALLEQQFPRLRADFAERTSQTAPAAQGLLRSKLKADLAASGVVNTDATAGWATVDLSKAAAALDARRAGRVAAASTPEVQAIDAARHAALIERTRRNSAAAYARKLAAKDDQKVAQIIEHVGRIQMLEESGLDFDDAIGKYKSPPVQGFYPPGVERGAGRGLIRQLFDPAIPASQQRITTHEIPEELKGQGIGQAMYLRAMKEGPINWEEPYKSLKLRDASSNVRAALMRKGLAEQAGDWFQLTDKARKLLKIPGYQEGGEVASTGIALVHKGETVLPPADTLRLAIDLNTKATIRAADLAHEHAAAMGRVAAGIAAAVLGLAGLVAPARAAAAGGVAGSVAQAVTQATGAPPGASAAISDVARVLTSPPPSPGTAGSVTEEGGGSAGGGAISAGGVGGPLDKIIAPGKLASTFGKAGLANLKSAVGIGGKAAPPGFVGPIDTRTSFKSVMGSQAVHTGEAVGGAALFEAGAFGERRGTWAGVGETTAGGAMFGAQFGPWGAAIGAAVGFGVGIGEKLAGVESKAHEAIRLVKQIYSITIDQNVGKQIADIAKQSFGNNVGMAVRSDQVRDLLRLWAQTTGQKNSLASLRPHAASLIESGGSMYQGAVYENGQAYTYASAYQTYGGVASQNLPTASPYAGSTTVTLNPQQTVELWRTGTAQAIAGDPRGVSASAASGDRATSSRGATAVSSLYPSAILQ